MKATVNNKPLQNKPVTISKSENSYRLLIREWQKPCRVLYGKCGIYTVYEHNTNVCLYVGKSTDLGKRCLRFFKPRTRVYTRPIGLLSLYDTPNAFNAFKQRFEAVHGEEIPTLAIPNCLGKVVRFYQVYLDVTTISNVHWLDRFERTLIAIKKPLYNNLLNYPL